MSMILVLGGCNKLQKSDDVQFEKYQKAYEKLNDQDHFLTVSSFYDIELVVNEVDDQYRLDVIVDNPKVAMYNIEMIYEINPTGKMQFETTLPSIGIVDNTTYNMVPYQVNENKGFHKGIVASGLTDKESGSVIVYITWTDYAKTKETTEFIELYYDAKAKD